MHGLSSSELLTVWEHGRRQAPAERALTLLGAARRTDAATLAEVTIGSRDRDLLALREATFGAELVATAPCPACGKRAELRFECADVRMEPSAEVAPQRLDVGGRSLSFRLPTGADLLPVGAEPNADAARHALLRRCLDPAEVALPEEVVTEIARRMAEADPQADVQLEVACPSCSCAWTAIFDIEAFLWSEIEARATGTLRDVDALAAAYGWSESEILALSPERRHTYLELVQS